MRLRIQGADGKRNGTQGSSYGQRMGFKAGSVFRSDKNRGKIAEKKSDYVFSLKGNQEKIHDDVKDFFTSHELDEKYCERYKIQKYEGELEIGHGRIEKREGFLCTNIKWLEGKAEWPNLKAVGMVRCHRTEKKTGKESSETRFFITSLTDAGKACQAMRSHWGVENGLHKESVNFRKTNAL